MQISDINNSMNLLNNRESVGIRVVDKVGNDSNQTKKTDRPKKSENLSLKSRQMGSMKINLNEVARKKGETAEKTAQMESYIERMKADLEKITKSFPPFLPGSEERIKRLRSFQSFRRLIDELTIPPKRDFDQMMVSSVQRDVSEVRAGEGLKIPELGEKATDRDIQFASEQLDKAKAWLDESHADIEEEMSFMIRHFEQQTQEILEINMSDAEAVADRDNEAEEESRSTRYALALRPGMSLTEAQSQLLLLI
ncbi:MAG: hypothetical protein V2J25_01005 [Desulfatiglans sp.]|jgi:hypothetical protein|nr:hypothetical protein [Desulfatiglans sp.]